MKIAKIWAAYFSPTGGTEKIVTMMSKMLGEMLNIPVQELDFSHIKQREKTYSFAPGDAVFLGTPVYAGRVPNKILPFFEERFKGNGAALIPVCVYGNRSYGSALKELALVMKNNGFRIAGAAATISAHAFSKKIAAGRPDEKDIKEIRLFITEIAGRIQGEMIFDVTEKINPPQIEPYYTPLKEDKTPAKFLKAKPVTDKNKCDQCGLCAKECPMGSIDANDCAAVPGICIKCQSCIQKCPRAAKSFADEAFVSHVKMLEKNYVKRSANQFI